MSARAVSSRVHQQEPDSESRWDQWGRNPLPRNIVCGVPETKASSSARDCRHPAPTAA